MLDRLKRRIPDAQDEQLLLDLLEDAGRFIRAYTGRDSVPEPLEGVQVSLAAVLFNRIGMEGETRTARAAPSASPSFCPRTCAASSIPFDWQRRWADETGGTHPRARAHRARAKPCATTWAPCGRSLTSPMPSARAQASPPWAIPSATPPTRSAPRRTGVRAARARKLLLPINAPIVEGDGVMFAGDQQVHWVCVTVDTWSAHIEARLERRF